MFYFSLYCKFNVIQGTNKVVVVEKFSYAKKWLEETSLGPLSTGIVLLIIIGFFSLVIVSFSKS